jgi:hypothetical protein
VQKEINGKLWERGTIFEVNGEPTFLCCQCSIKIIKSIIEQFLRLLRRTVPEEELKKVYEKMNTDEINELHVPQKYIDSLYVEEADWTYRLAENAMVKCEQCGEIVI